MADKHPYMSGSSGLVQAVNHLRRSFPTQVTAETLKKLGIAPNNETYVINILRFIKVIDDEGRKAAKAGSVFTKHDDADFQKGFAEMVEEAYSDLFSLHSKDAWSLPIDRLISYFRETDRTSAIVGQRQAGTFQALAGLSGYGEAPVPKPVSPVRRGEKKRRDAESLKKAEPQSGLGGVGRDRPHELPRNFGLSVRIEINLPVAPDQETYDRIFKSIRENLLSAE